MVTTRYYSLAEAAKELGVHVNTLRRWVAADRVPFVTWPSGQKRITGEQLDQIKEQMTGTSQGDQPVKTLAAA